MLYVVSPSHPMWMRGLKSSAASVAVYLVVSHPMWMRGLKHAMAEEMIKMAYRIPCRCVD